MDKATTVLYQRESAAAKRREDSARGGMTAYEKAAEKYLGDRSFGSGLLYGALFFAVMDEGMLTALKLTPPPKNFPWQTHVRGLADRLLLGAVLEVPYDVADAAA